MTPAQVKKIKLDPSEHSEYLFATIDEAMTLLNPYLAKRLPHCVKAREAQMFIYLEGGELV